MGELLVKAVSTGANIIITGATASGKTTLLRAILEANPERRSVVLERVPELKPQGVLALEVNLEKDISALEFDQIHRLVEGEMPISSSYLFAQAYKQQVPYTSTLHGSPKDALRYFEEQLSKMSETFNTLIVEMAKDENRRYVKSISQLLDASDGSKELRTIFVHQPKEDFKNGSWTGDESFLSRTMRRTIGGIQPRILKRSEVDGFGFRMVQVTLDDQELEELTKAAERVQSFLQRFNR